MPIYETLTSEKLTVVLDIGTSFTKLLDMEFPRNLLQAEADVEDEILEEGNTEVEVAAGADMDLGLLIEAIQTYPYLYDLSNRLYKDAKKKALAWQNISDMLNCTVEDCMKAWRNLRDRFVKEKNKLPSGAGAPESNWPFFEVMLFYGKYTKPRKFGFTSEFAPRYIIRSEIRCKKTNLIRRICDYESPEDLHDLLVDFIHMIYFKCALISPKDRPIVIVESLLCPTLFRETLAKVLFLQYEVSSVLVLPSHLVALASLAVDTALVVDVGYKEAVAIPVCYGLPIVQAWQALPLGGDAIHSNLKSLLSNSNTGVQNLPEHVLEDIKIRCCFVTKKSRAEQWNLARPEIAPPPEVKYSYEGRETLTVTGKVREKAFEILYDEDNDHLCLSTMILDAILKVDIDLRQKLAENLILIGGTVMTLGFKARLKDELEKQLGNKRYEVLNIKEFMFHSPPCKENYAAWLGGAIYGATEFLTMKAVSKEFYLREKHLPDWINLKDANNVRPSEPAGARAL